MKKKILLLTSAIATAFCLLLCTTASFGQILYPIGGDQYSSATGRLFNEAYSPSKDSAAVPVILTKISRGRSVDTAPLVKAFPNHRIPATTIPVALPDLSGYTDTVAVLWYLRNPTRPSVGVVNVMLIAQNQDQEYTYFVDSNNNGSFLDDGRPFQFKLGEKQRLVDVRDNRIGEVTLMLRNLVPAGPSSAQYEFLRASSGLPAERPARKKREKKEHTPKAFGVHFIGGLSSGSGNASMFFRVKDRPDLDETNKSYHYTARYYASLNTKLGLALSYRNLYIGGSGSYELSQVGEQNVTIRYHKAGTPTSQFLNNQGNWPYTRFNLTAFAEYDIPLTNSLRLAPMLAYTRYDILTDQPFRIFGEAKLNDYFRDRYAYSYGAKVKYAMTEQTKLFIELYRRENFFDASTYFPEIEQGTFGSDLKQVYVGVGIQLKVFEL